MNSHQNARLTVHGRALLVTRILKHGLRPEEAAQAMGVSVRTAYKWLARYRKEGRSGLRNRSSRPYRCPHQIDETRRQRIIQARYKRRIYRQISQETGISVSTIA
ncbi:leucine zipper domain-containing protein, partial [Alloalcanivorax profundimaris]|uniref:leucine zipper domain-containing protein n=1 Tax=Alloalcanivorax profundimaris TaxID=2735259 RepID=UPI0018890E93